MGHIVLAILGVMALVAILCCIIAAISGRDGKTKAERKERHERHSVRHTGSNGAGRNPVVHSRSIYGGGKIKTDILKGDADFQGLCEGLLDRGTHVSPGEEETIWTDRNNGVEIGFRMQIFHTYVNRQVFIKTPGHKIDEMSDEERERVMSAVFNVFVLRGSNIPSITQIAPDCLVLQQQSIPMILTERNPRLRSIAGGIG